MPLRKIIAKLQEKWSGRIASRRAPKLKSIRRLELELLETRDLLAASGSGAVVVRDDKLNLGVLRRVHPVAADPQVAGHEVGVDLDARRHGRERLGCAAKDHLPGVGEHGRLGRHEPSATRAELHDRQDGHGYLPGA